MMDGSLFSRRNQRCLPYFSEVVGKKNDLFKALDISLPEDEMGVSYEDDDKAGVNDEDYTNVEDLPV